MPGLNRLWTLRRFASVFVFMVLLSVTVNAYTVVMRGGKRVEIPARFTVTPTTLTYEAGLDVQVTIQMSAIDIAETEKANNEKPGSLLGRMQSAPSESTTASGQSQNWNISVPQAKRTITNRDLEMARRRRQDSEKAYEQRRKELGLPSVEESRRRADAEAEAIRMELRQQRATQDEAEAYWRERANSLRTEMAELDAEIGWIGARLDADPSQPSNGWGWGSTNTFNNTTPFISFGDSFGRGPSGRFGRGGYYRSRSPGVFVAPRQGNQIRGRAGFGGRGTRGQILVNPGRFSRRGFGTFGQLPFGSGVAVVGPTISGYDDSYERSDLITRFNELAAQRAGLNARWRELEDEARRAGAQPGWLRP